MSVSQIYPSLLFGNMCQVLFFLESWLREEASSPDLNTRLSL